MTGKHNRYTYVGDILLAIFKTYNEYAYPS